MRHHPLRENWTVTGVKDMLVVCACSCFALVLLNPYDIPSSGTDYHVSAEFLSNTTTNAGNTVYFYKNDVRDLKHPALVLYVWKQGDSLATLAQSYALTPDSIMKLNGIKAENEIHAGRIIYISHTAGIIFIVRDYPLSLRTLSLDYDLDLTLLMRNNKQSDPDYAYVPGEPILLPGLTADQAIAMGLRDEQRKTITSFVSRSATLVNVSPQFTAESREITSHNPRILKTRVYKFREDNGMTPGFCTYYVAHRATRAFPKITETRRFRGIQGNAIEWLRDAQRKGFKTSKTPSAGAIVVYGRGTGGYGYAGHVAYVESVDRTNKTMTVSDMNYVGLWTATTRIVNMNDTMTKSTSDRQSILGFIPMQELPSGLKEQYQKTVSQ